MGILQDFFKWVRKKENFNQMLYNLELLNRNLEYERKTLQKEERKQYIRAKKFRMEGNNQGARLYMEHRLRYQKWAIAVDNYRLNIVGLIHQIQMAKNQVEIAKNLSGVQKAIKSLVNDVKIPKLGEMMANLQQDLQQFDLTGEFIEDNIEEGTQTSIQVTDTDINESMKNLDAEITTEAKKALLPPSERMVELEKELKKLKEDTI